MSHGFKLEIEKGYQSPPEKNSTLSGIDALNAWIENLPMANIGSTTQLFYERIRHLNATEMSPDNRFEIMEALRETHRHIRIGLTAKYSGTRFPLSEKRRQVAEINRELIHQMAIGYKIIVQNHASGKEKVSTKMLVNAIGRAGYYLGSSLLESYRIYAQVREMTWFEIHSLYRYAYQEEIHTKHFTDILLGDSSTTIEKVYSQLLIVAAIDPYRLPRGESNTIFSEMGNWLQYVRLSPTQPENQPVGVYLVKLNSDMPPIHMSSYLAQAEGFSLYLDCSKLADEIRKRTSTEEQGSLFPWRKHKSDISREALNTLVIALGAVGERLLRRTRTSAKVDTIVGITNIHQELAGPLELATSKLPTRHKPIFESHDIPSLADRAESRADVWSFSPKATRPQSAEHLYVDFPTYPPEPAVQEVEKAQLQVIDISSGGYCLSADSSLSDKVQVGDLLAMRETENINFSWKVGCIQWIIQEKEGSLTLGIKVFHANPVPVMVKAKKEDGYYSSQDQALLLPAVPACNQKPALLTEPLPYKTGMQVQLRDKENIVNIELKKLVAATPSFVLHEYDSLNKIEQNPQAAAPFNDCQIKELLSSL